MRTYAKCVTCNTGVHDFAFNTSNFIRHTKGCNHDIYNDYKKLSQRKAPENELDSQKKKLTQENINLFIFKYLIIQCALPYRLVECEGMNKFNLFTSKILIYFP